MPNDCQINGIFCLFEGRNGGGQSIAEIINAIMVNIAMLLNTNPNNTWMEAVWLGMPEDIETRTVSKREEKKHKSPLGSGPFWMHWYTCNKIQNEALNKPP